MPKVRGLAAVLAAGTLLLGACESAPLMFRGDEAPGLLTLPLDGAYDATVHSHFTGSIRMRLLARPSEEGFVAMSRPDVAWALIGGLEGFFGPLVAGGLFPGGAIVIWRSTLPEHGRPGSGAIGAGTAFTVPTEITSAHEPVEVLFNGRRLGLMTFRLAGEGAAQPADYQALVERVEQTMRDRLFDPALAEAPAVRRYLSRLRYVAGIAQDDLEFAFGAEAARRRIRMFSQVLLLKGLDPAIARILDDRPGVRTGLISVSGDFSAGITTLRVDAFIDSDGLDRAMDEIVQENPRGLIVDLRRARVGDLAAFRVAARLLEEPTPAGILCLPSRRDDAAAGRIEGFPRIEAGALGAGTELRAAVEQAGAVIAMVEPVAPVYRGPVVILTAKVTASSAEALAWTLQKAGRATLVGERTAGKMLAPERVDVGQGWVLQLPVFDFYTPDGTRIEGNGVEPDVRVDDDDAPASAMDVLRSLLSGHGASD